MFFGLGGRKKVVFEKGYAADAILPDGICSLAAQGG
jgi:hypothetical protein